MLVAGVLLSASTITTNAAVVKKDPKDVKIYINPGHGGYNANSMGTVKRGEVKSNDTTAFCESNTNLWKAWALFHKLKDYGVTHTGTGIQSARDMSQGMMMSHVKYDGTDRSLPEIAAEAEQYKPDIFLSIHSNANPEGSLSSNENYPLVLYRGEDYKSGTFPNTSYGKNYDYAGTGFHGAGNSYELAKLVYSHLATIKHEPYTSEWNTTSKGWYEAPLEPQYNARGDVDFMYFLKNKRQNTTYTMDNARGVPGVTNSYSGNKYYGFYGVMKHGAVGVLSEGYFHTYTPSINRHINKDVCAIEGISYAHAIADYFGWEKEKKGYIYGIVRDRNQTFSHTYYSPNQNSDDIYKPLNNCTVNLYKDGVLVDTYVTDDEYNGAFVFYDLEPGDYTLDYECTGYTASQGLKATVVTVKANEISYPKAFLNATGYTMKSEVTMSTTPVVTYSGSAGWYGTSGNYISQIAVTNDVVYTIMTGGNTISYWNASTNGSGSFSIGTSSGANGPGICTDDNDNLVIASGPNYNQRLTQISVIPKSSGAGVLVDPAQVKHISLSGKYTTTFSNGTGVTKAIYASGNCYNGTGALWLTDGLVVVKVPIVNGVAQAQSSYTAPSQLTINGSSVWFGGNSNATWNKSSQFIPYGDNKYILGNRNGTFLCSLSGTTVNSVEYVDGLWYPFYSADIDYIGGHEIIVHEATQSTTGSDGRDGKITIKDRTTGKNLASAMYAYGSAATPVNLTGTTEINAWCEFDKINENTLGLYTYVPGHGFAKYLIKATSSPDDPVAVTGATGSSEAEIASNNYEPNITVTWEAPSSWEQQPTNYLVQYKMNYVNENGETIQFYNDWQTAGMTKDATCKFVHEGVEFGVSSTTQTVLPLIYEYRIIPNFNCYDGEVSEISKTVTVEFVAPKPQWDSFTIEPVTEVVNGVEELKQYDATATWNGVAFESNKEFSLQGYKLELFRSEDTEKVNPVASFSFKVTDSKYFGELTNNVGAILDENGNIIENLTYSKAIDPSTGKTVNQFHYNAYDLDVLDVNNNGTAEGKEFTAQVTAEFWIVDGSFAYGTDNIPVTYKKAYTPVAPSLRPTVYYYEKPDWGDWDADNYGNPAKGEYDVDDAYWKVYWVNMDITKPNADAPVSSYTISLSSQGKSDVKEVMLYDPKQSLGLPLITEGYAKDYVALPVNDIAVASYSTRATVEPSSATFTIPGNYDFSQAEADNVPMATFYVKDFDTTVNNGATDYDGNNSALNYTYNVTANYASGNKAISSTATGGANPVNGGITTSVENIEIAELSNNVVVFPVPATVSVTIKAPEAISQVVIYSATGNTVKSIQGDGENAMTIAVDDLEEGTYFISVNNLAPAKIIKK